MDACEGDDSEYLDSVILLDDKYTELRGRKKKSVGERGRLPPAEDGGINKVFYLRQSSVF